MKWIGWVVAALALYLAWRNFNRLPDGLTFGQQGGLGTVGTWNAAGYRTAPTKAPGTYPAPIEGGNAAGSA